MNHNSASFLGDSTVALLASLDIIYDDDPDLIFEECVPGFEAACHLLWGLKPECQWCIELLLSMSCLGGAGAEQYMSICRPIEPISQQLSVVSSVGAKYIRASHCKW